MSEEQKKADGLLAHLGAIRAVLIIDGGDKMSPELRKALWLDHEVALDLQRVRRDLVETVRAWRHGGNDAWPKVEAALNALEKVEAARVEKGLPLETRIIEKRICVASVGGFKCQTMATDGDLCDIHKDLDNT